MTYDAKRNKTDLRNGTEVMFTVTALGAGAPVLQRLMPKPKRLVLLQESE